jgi:hypothetical protein
MLAWQSFDAKNPETQSENSATKFAWGARLGTKSLDSGQTWF